MFSQLMNTNWNRMGPQKTKARWQEAMAFLMFAVRAASHAYHYMIAIGGVFAFEHPTGASSWRLPEMQAIMEKTGVELVTFDQCRFVLASPISIVAFTGILLQQFNCWTTFKQPIRKSTSLLTSFRTLQSNSMECSASVLYHAKRFKARKSLSNVQKI